ncbi:hypothetical protein GCM10011613_00780 [Cellvibrio zantedeschiae]|uniref:Lipoprotein n=1 Tax=Cellvibrio zantedeschiae TaxID=1237077 RepID=A0ABQ3AMI1_9GAMM|nr:hypothetical protein [Cellvibrio zantedeschiae]GGY61244.1 hypothetical protein GCM10011613_00780 [Cellvibrio zantedeschiae]
MKPKIILLLIPILLSSCTNTVWVREAKIENEVTTYKSVGGIPFYVKKNIYTHNSKYSTTWLKATLTITYKTDATNAKPSNEQIYEVEIPKTELIKLTSIKKLILEADPNSFEDTAKVTSEFVALQEKADITQVKPELIANFISTESIVDTEKPYYLNAPLPWFGSNSLTQELAADGTLSKVTAAPDTHLSEAITSLIPLKEYLTKRFVGSSTEALVAESGGGNTTSVVWDLSLNIIETGYIHTFTEALKSRPTGPLKELDFDTTKYAFTREPITSASEKKEKKEENKNVISINGTIGLPKPEAAKK